MFRFDNYLALSPEFMPSVQQVWQHHIIGALMYAVTRKLKALKPVFREQRRNKGDLSHNVQLAKGFLEMPQLLVSSNRRDEQFLQLEHCCRLVLAKAAKLEQCSRVFFRKIAQRRSARRILQINDDHGATHTDLGAALIHRDMPKVAWKDVCKPIVEGGQGIKDIGILNRALMAKKLCDVIRCDRTSIWVEWLKHGRLRDNSIWAINEKGGSWGWRKLLRLRSSILPMTEFLIGEGRTFFLWKDPWHHLGPPYC
ncbi:UNVERIFIED_CONTAM: hypothetical protein Sindi_2654900 [Sesamum indicum]